MPALSRHETASALTNYYFFRKDVKALGRKNKSYHKDLKQQAHDKLTGMLALGESKKAAKADGTYRDKIFSASTFQNYKKHIKYFCDYVEEAHPEATTLRAARKFMGEWLESRENTIGKDDKPLSAWTIQLEASALSKLYGITPEDEDYYHAPERKRADIKRSREPAKRDAGFSETNNFELIQFCKGTGLRIKELEELKPEQFRSKAEIEQRITELEALPERTDAEAGELATLLDTRLFEGAEYFLKIKGKGGRIRFSPIIGNYSASIVQRIKTTEPGAHVWEHVNSHADIHGYRSDYAVSIYKAYARKIEDIPYDSYHTGIKQRYQSEVYSFRKDEAGKKLDKRAMLIASKALGHNRIDVIANNYLRGI